jgi:hypothetical protein
MGIWEWRRGGDIENCVIVIIKKWILLDQEWPNRGPISNWESAIFRYFWCISSIIRCIAAQKFNILGKLSKFRPIDQFRLATPVIIRSIWIEGLKKIYVTQKSISGLTVFFMKTDFFMSKVTGYIEKLHSYEYHLRTLEICNNKYPKNIPWFFLYSRNYWNRWLIPFRYLVIKYPLFCLESDARLINPFKIHSRIYKKKSIFIL